MNVSLDALSWYGGMGYLSRIFSFLSFLFADAGGENPVKQQNEQQKALNEMAKWLSQSKEFGEKPVEQQIIHEREIGWPWEKHPIKVFLIKYRMKNGLQGIGFTGPTTWSLASIEHWRALTPEDWIYCYVGWYIQFFFTHSKDFPQEISPETTNRFVRKLIEKGDLDPHYYQVRDVLKVGKDSNYYAIETIKDGKQVYLVGTQDNYIFYNKDLPQMQLPPLFYFLGKTFNPFKEV